MNKTIYNDIKKNPALWRGLYLCVAVFAP